MTDPKTGARLAVAPPDDLTLANRIAKDMRASPTVLHSTPAQSRAADEPWEAIQQVCPADDSAQTAADRAVVGRVLEQLDMEAAVGCGWWETDTAAVVLGVVSAGPAATVFVELARLLLDGHDAEVMIGATSAVAAFAVAQEWLDAGVAATEVAGWLRAGCWKPTAARALTEAGLRPERLLDGEGRPLHWVDVPTPDGEQVPIARAVAEEFVTVAAAVQSVIEHVP